MAPAEPGRSPAVSGFKFPSAPPPSFLSIQPRPTVATLSWLALWGKDQGPPGQLGQHEAPPSHLFPTFQSTQTGEIWIGDRRAQVTMVDKDNFVFV